MIISDNEFSDVDLELVGIKNYIDRNRFEKNTKYLISYSVIRTCGIIEIVFKKLIHLYVSEGSKMVTTQYLSRKIIDSSDNPTVGNIERLLDEIDPKLKNEFKLKYTTQEKSDLNSLVSNRNDFAHGRSITISIDVVIKYFESSKRLMQYLADVLIWL